MLFVKKKLIFFVFWLNMCSIKMNETRHNKQGNVKTTEIHGTGCTVGGFHTSTCPCVR